MFDTGKNIYVQETEIKPNRYATYALLFALFSTVFCFVLTAVGLFRVGFKEMTIGTILSVLALLIPIIMLFSKKQYYANIKTKYIIMIAGSFFTLVLTTLLTFHTTIMLLFPIMMGMLYRSKSLGRLAFACSLVCTIVSPVLGYVLGTWDIPLFQELILIGTNGNAVIQGAYAGISLISIAKIVFYLVLPRLLLVGACSILMFYVIYIGVNHVNNQIALNDISHIDALTGLFNRNYLTDVIADPSFKGNCVVFFFDVNGLKKVNDSLGHEIGDMLICKCADCLRGLCNEEKSGAFRMGGDEFVILYFGIGEEEAKNLIICMECALKEASNSSEMKENNIACSMAAGYAVGDFSEAEKLIHMADERMYENKKIMKQSI